jgi:alginate O-acetyltransferase complex protein AlgI
MVFASPIFLFAFFPAALLICYLAGLTKKPDVRNAALFLFSLLFYAWGEPTYVLVMLASIIVNYLLGLRVQKSKALFALAIVFNLGLLGVFKYLDMLISTADWALRINLPLARIAPPIGISFYTFQIMSYVIDVRRGDVAVQKNPLRFATYVVMFPQLIAGPIVRYVDVERDLGKVDIRLDAAATGVRRFCVGLAKKALIANAAAKIADAAFSAPWGISFDAAWLGAIAYAVQIYFDFSGYSDMAIGMGQMLGFHFLENFEHPYISRSIREFWRRWHISLSTWFRDYLYIPMGGSRKGSARTLLNLVIVFTLCGLWHGAKWSFVIWGLWHGLFLCFERIPLVKKALDGLPRALGTIYAFLVVLVGWVLFRADSLTAALDYLSSMFSLKFGAGADAASIVDARTGILLLVGLAFCFKWPKIRSNAFTQALGTVAALLLLALSALTLAGGTYNPFIYFRF